MIWRHTMCLSCIIHILSFQSTPSATMVRVFSAMFRRWLRSLEKRMRRPPTSSRWQLRQRSPVVVRRQQIPLGSGFVMHASLTLVLVRITASGQTVCGWFPCRGFPEVDEGSQARRVPELAYQPKGSQDDGFGRCSSKAQTEGQTQGDKAESCHLYFFHILSALSKVLRWPVSVSKLIWNWDFHLIFSSYSTHVRAWRDGEFQKF